MIPLLITLIVYMVYLTINAKDDHAQALTGLAFSHKHRVYLRACCAGGMLMITAWELTILIPWYRVIIVCTIFGLFLDAIGWAYFDAIYNIYGKFKWDRLGTGGIDKWFTTQFGVHASYNMKWSKLLFILLTGLLLFYLLIRYHLI